MQDASTLLTKTNQFLSRILKIGAKNPRDIQYIFGIANAAAEAIANPQADTRCFERINVLDLADATTRWTLQLFPGVGASVSPMECAALAALIAKTNASRVFEFGTYKGVSTTQLALNISPQGRVFTLDLPEDHPAYSLEISKESERAIASEKGKGILVPADLRDRVTFLRFDSAKFDTTPYLESMDLVFVDGAHSYDYVENDTIKGWKMLRSGGAIAWHDCVSSHPDVVRFLKGFRSDIKLVDGTAIAFAVKP